MQRLWRHELNQRDGGFTLVELMVAMMVIATVLMMLIGVQISASATIKDARLRQQATALANESLEQMRAIPWNVLTRGMHTSFDRAYVSGSTLTRGSNVFTLRIAGAGSQNASQPWKPLFDTTGSNTQVRLDPSGTGTEFTVRSYVTEPTIGSEGIGLLAVVDWVDTKGRDQFTVVHAPNFAAMSCHTDPDRSPFAGACQSMLSSASSTGPMISSLSASFVDPVTNLSTPMPVISGHDAYIVEMTTASTSSSALSEQTTLVESRMNYGGTARSTDPRSASSETTTESAGRYLLAASNDPPTPDAVAPNPANVTVNHPAITEGVLSMSGSGVTLRARSDSSRPGLLQSSVTQSCQTGVPAGEPCTRAQLTNLASDTTGSIASGYMSLELANGQTLRLVRRINESGGNIDRTWAARFGESPGTSATGCSTLVGAGCAAAGAERQLGTVMFGTLLGGAAWDHGNQHLVTVTNLTESVRVQRGGHSSQKTSTGTVSRTGSIGYWDGTQWQTLSLNSNTLGSYPIGPSTYTSGDYSIEVLSGTLLVAGMYDEIVGSDPSCLASACQLTTSGGQISVTYDFMVRTPSAPDGVRMTFSTSINPIRATAVYKEVDA